MILSPNERCPIHKQKPFTCPCHRVQGRKMPKGSKWETVRLGVRRTKDQFADHPDGYRYKLSAGEIRKVLLKKLADQEGRCALCNEEFVSLIGIVADHIKPKGMQGGRADDRESNIQAAHYVCNMVKGSSRSDEKAKGTAA
jgi:HNH endonuclease